MPTKQIKVGRSLSTLRIGAYECTLDSQGNPRKQSGQVIGWYGSFTTDRLQKEIMPKLAEYAAQGKRYPFLIATYELRSKAEVNLPRGIATKDIKDKDIDFSRREQDSALVPKAVVSSPGEYRLLNH
jgi:hypothetical protein